jgi:hypothetical protein
LNGFGSHCMLWCFLPRFQKYGRQNFLQTYVTWFTLMIIRCQVIEFNAKAFVIMAQIGLYCVFLDISPNNELSEIHQAGILTLQIYTIYQKNWFILVILGLTSVATVIVGVVSHSHLELHTVLTHCSHFRFWTSQQLTSVFLEPPAAYLNCLLLLSKAKINNTRFLELTPSMYEHRSESCLVVHQHF